MANISGGKPALQVAERPNTFISAVEARVFAFSYSDDRSNRHVGLAVAFGKDTSDGGLGVFLLKSPAEMEDLKIASPLVRDGIRKLLAGEEPVSEIDIPDHLLGLGGSDDEPIGKQVARKGQKAAKAG